MMPVAPGTEALRTTDANGRVVSLENWRREHAAHTPLPLRLAPEIDDFQVLYRNSQNHNKLYALNIIGWALLDDGSVDALVPWLDTIQLARQLRDPLQGAWEGYYLGCADLILDEPPPHKVAELQSAAEYFGLWDAGAAAHAQSLPDTSGTWALLYQAEKHRLRLEPVARWILGADGRMNGQLYADPGHGEETLDVPAHPEFRYFLHASVVNLIMEGGDEAFNALADTLQH